VKDMGYIPDRGHIIWISLNPQVGHEQSGRRPAVVLSPSLYNNKSGLAILCPITNQIKGYPFEVVIPPGNPISGVILADQVKCLDWRVRNAELICILPKTVVTEVLRKIETLLHF